MREKSALQMRPQNVEEAVQWRPMQLKQQPGTMLATTVISWNPSFHEPMARAMEARVVAVEPMGQEQTMAFTMTRSLLTTEHNSSLRAKVVASGKDGFMNNGRCNSGRSDCDDTLVLDFLI
jgi:hypothetical protein